MTLLALTSNRFSAQACSPRREARNRSMVTFFLAVLMALLALTVLSVSAGAQTESVLVSFTGTGGAAAGNQLLNNNLIQASDGNFYGMTSSGGGSNDGVAFRMTTAGAYTLLHTFTGGTTDGLNPRFGLVQGIDGNFYGLTYGGGANSSGGIAFQMTPAGVVTLLHSFGAAGDGKTPYSTLIQGTDGNFYGTTYAGGANGYGTIFVMTPGGTETVLHSFSSAATDGKSPYAGLVQGADGNFYGTTLSGGANTYGCVYQMTPGGTFTIIHSFSNSTADGRSARPVLVQGADGNLYGTTDLGGAANLGTVFNISPAGTYNQLYSFSGGATDGQYPYAGLTLGSDGNFYGTTFSGGTGAASAGDGTTFKVTPSGTETLLRSFQGNPDGLNPQANLAQGADGNFYGVTQTGGTSNYGTVFVQTPIVALAAPVAMSAPSTVITGSTFTLSFSVANAYSKTLQQCFATNTAGDTTWVGVKTGSPSTTAISLTAPSMAGAYAYTLTCGGSESNMLTINALPPPVVTSIAPTSGQTRGGANVIITGTGLSGATAVRFGTQAASSFIINSATSITAVDPATTSTGAVDVTVTTASGTSATSSADQFTYTVTSSTATLTASPASSTYGSILTLTATLNNTAATGTVTFYSNYGKLGTASPSSGVATLTSTALPVGTSSVYAVYGGDAGNTGSTSNTLSILVGAPTTPVASASATAQVIFNFSSTVTLNSTLATAIQVLTLGVANADFKYASGGTCAAGTTYNSGQSCTAYFSFTPKMTGLRLGVVQLYNSAATPVLAASSYISGVGTAPILAFNDTTAVFASPTDQAASYGLSSRDPSGYIYYGFGGSSVYKLLLGGSPATFYTGATTVTGTGLDGAGNVYVLQRGYAAILKISPVGTLLSTIAGLSTRNYQIAFGPDGTAYVANSDNGIFTISPNGIVSAFTETGTTTATAEGVCVDSSGNVYIADYVNTRILKVAPGGVSAVFASGVSATGVAVDAAGNVYATTFGSTITRYTPAGVVSGTFSANGAASTPSSLHGLTYDGKGNLFAMDASTDILYEFTLTGNPATAFNAAAVGTTSADSPKTVYGLNIGNAPLTITSFTAPQGFSINAGATTCPTTNAATLAVNASCAFGLSYTPASATAASGNFVVANNYLNGSLSQSLPVTGATATTGTKTITFPQPATPVGVGTTTTLTATVSDADGVTFAITGGTATASLNGSQITYFSTGTVQITASSASANATAATPVVRTVTVVPGALTGSVTGVNSLVGSTLAVNVTASATTSGGTNPIGTVVTFSVTSPATGTFSPSTCTLNGTTTFSCTVSYTPTGSLSAGTYSNDITASFAASANFNASSATSTLIIGAEGSLVNFTGIAGAQPGALPDSGNIIQASDGNFYGLTIYGASSNYGAVYAVNAAGAYTVLHAFAGGTTDGEYSQGGLTQGTDGNLYGTTQQGGTANDGVVFGLTPAGTFTLLHSFAGGTADGSSPYGSLVQGNDGYFYGITQGGGSGGRGTVFRISAAGTYTLLHSFVGGSADGSFPYGGMVQGADGYLYGTTNEGGPANGGTVYRIDTAGASVVLVHSFAGGTTDGISPYGALVQGADGSFYGTAYGGGTSGNGVIYKVNAGGSFALLHSFTGAVDGLNPKSSMVLGSDGNFYGTAAQGGSGNDGTLYTMSPSGSTFTLLHTFIGNPDGNGPSAGVVQGMDGNIYGTTTYGGTLGNGTLFKQLTPQLLAAPVLLNTSSSTVATGKPFTLTYSVANAYSATLQHCFVTNTASNPGWTGVMNGSTSPTAVNLTAGTITGTYTYTLTCGGMESNLISITVASGNTPATATVSAVTVPYGSTTGVTVTASESGSNGAVTGGIVTFSAVSPATGTFSPATCTLSAAGTCSTTYVPTGTLAAGTYATGIQASFAAVNGYIAASATNTLTVNASVITWNPSTHSVPIGAAIGAGVLDATSSSTGTFAYTATNASNATSTVTATTVLSAGAYTLTANFTPSNPTLYPYASATIAFSVVPQSVFIVNAGGSVTTTLDSGNSQSSSVSGGGIGAAVDASGNVWSVYASGAGVSKFNDTGTLAANYTASNLTSGTALAVDGNGTVWIAQGSTANNVFALANTGTVLSTTGFAQAANLSTPASITVNAAGSLWIANTGSNTVTEIIGVAAPVTTPTVQQIINQNPGIRP